MSPIELKSNVCLSPGQCYDIKTEVPLWMVIVLTGATILLLKEIYNSLT